MDTTWDVHCQYGHRHMFVFRSPCSVHLNFRSVTNCDAGGDRFEDRFDQEALLDILVRTERDHARPTAAVQKQLKEAWGWVDE